jgi:hypothetical protein
MRPPRPGVEHLLGFKAPSGQTRRGCGPTNVELNIPRSCVPTSANTQRSPMQWLSPTRTTTSNNDTLRCCRPVVPQNNTVGPRADGGADWAGFRPDGYRTTEWWCALSSSAALPFLEVAPHSESRGTARPLPVRLYSGRSGASSRRTRSAIALRSLMASAVASRSMTCCLRSLTSGSPSSSSA